MVYLLTLDPWPIKSDGLQCRTVVVAKDEAEARAMAAMTACDEGPGAWEDPARSRAEAINPNIRRQVLNDGGAYGNDGY